MRQRDLLKKISKAAKRAGTDFEFVRHGAAHDIYRCGGQQFSIPRHTEINELTAKGIMSDLEDQLGMGWWK